MILTKKIGREILTEFRDIETWPGHFLAKETESDIVFGKIPLPESGRGLEIGCGNGFQSALLSYNLRELVSTDLYEINPATHTVGMQKAHMLLKTLNINNVKLVSCDAENLPFADEHFDFVFSASTIEHIRNKQKAVQEIKRVLRPQGVFVMIVPTHMASFYAPLNLFVYILCRAVQIFRKINIKSRDKETSGNNVAQPSATWSAALKRFKKNHPSFPLPEPHGDYPTVFHEFCQQFPFIWVALLKKNGFRIKESFSTCILPWSLIEPFSTSAIAQWYASLKDFHSRYGHLGIARYCGYLICFIAQKV